MDPFEKKSVFVDQSSIFTAEEGLFAQRMFSPGDLISYYSGQKTYLRNIVPNNMTSPQAEVAAAFNFGLGKYAPKNWGYPDMDIELEFRNMSAFTTTLGHKAAHKFSVKNGLYDLVDHPVVGGIACIVARD